MDATVVTTEFDIAICGAGPVGMALALLLVERAVPAARIALIDAKPLAVAAADPRSIALAHGSAQILQRIGAWPIPATAIHQIRVSRRGHFGRTLIRREDHDLPALGYVTRYGALATALGGLISASAIHSRRPATVASLDEGPDSVTVQLEDGSTLSAGIVVQAEGGATGQAVQHDYRQSALVAQVKTSAPIAHRAFERFTEEGPLALLPQDDGYALVWCARPDSIEDLLALPPDAFLARLGEMFGTRLGSFTEVSARHAFPLLRNVGPAPTARTVAIGNAAQTLHPVAGQGLNLGLRDALVLAAHLSRQTSPEQLRAFVRERSTDRSTTIRFTDGLARLFASAPSGAVSQTLLGASLGVVDILQPAKRALAEQMMFGWRS